MRFKKEDVIKNDNRYFLTTPNVRGLLRNNFTFAGRYLGKLENGSLHPGFPLLKIIAEKENTNRVIIDERTEWLFICGRDIFLQGLVKVSGSAKKGTCALVLNRYGECLGYGLISCDIAGEKNPRKVVVKNTLDIGDFLRRET